MTEATAEKGADVEITELEKIEPTRVDGVKSAANGFPILMMKSVEVPAEPQPTDARTATLELVKAVLDGGLTAPVLAKDADGYDESADITGAMEVIARISTLICSEATALGTGRMEESYDIYCLMQAVEAMQTFLGREQSQDDGAGSGDGMTPLAQSAADDEDEPGTLVKGKYTAEQKRKMLADGHAIANAKGKPSYPIGDKVDLGKAIDAVGRGGSDHDAVRAHVIASAKRLDASDMIPENWNPDGSLKTSKALASENDPTPVVTTTAVDITETVEKAVAKAIGAAEGRVKALEAEVARLQKMPVPGGPMLLRPQDIPSTQTTKSDRYKALALEAPDASVRAAYTALAKQAAQAD